MALRNISVFKQFTGEQIGHVRLKPKDETETDKERNPLGWYYQSGQGEFFGLILDNLTRKVRAH